MADGPDGGSGPDRGSGTVLMAVLMVVAGFLVMLVLALGGVVVARHRAGAIADLAALAAASEPPGPTACERARRVAQANAGRVMDCRILNDGSVVVEVKRAGPGPPGGRFGIGGLLARVTGSARAGAGPPTGNGP
jgi:secretion/DNA translocation related TadE-like protein